MPDSTPESLISPGDPEAIALRDRVTAVLEILLCSSIPTQLAIGALLRAVGVRSSDAAGHLSLTFVLALSLADTALLIVMMILLMHAHGESARRTWIGAPRSRPLREALVGLGTVPLVFVGVGLLLNAIRLAVPSLHNVRNQSARAAGVDARPGRALFACRHHRGRRARGAAARVHAAPLRAVLGGATLGVWVLSAAFGLGHAMQGWDAVITTAALGAFWAWMYLQRRSSIGPIVSHAGFNSLEILRVAMIGQ